MRKFLKYFSALAVCLGRSQAASRLLCDNDSSPGEAPKGDEGHLQIEVRYKCKVTNYFRDDQLLIGLKFIADFYANTLGVKFTR